MSDWDSLLTQQRHQLRYPSEHVVRFLSGLPEPNETYGLLIDIGCGYGRHLRLATEMGFLARGCDASLTAVTATRLAEIAAGVEWGYMTKLPYPGNHFDVAIAYGVFYYGNPAYHRQAARELHRVLRPGGHALIKTRTARDWRATQPDLLHNPQEPEHGMTMNFLTAHAITDIYGQFSDVTYELTETTTHQRGRTNSDWLIQVTK